MARTATTTPQITHSERAQWAWDKVSEARGLGDATAKEYATHVRKLPARIQTNGLGQALAFLFAKNKSDKRETGAGRLLLHLGHRIEGKIRGAGSLKHPDEIMKALVNMTPDEYRLCTHELLVTGEWLKRFVDGLFGKEVE